MPLSISVIAITSMELKNNNSVYQKAARLFRRYRTLDGLMQLRHCLSKVIMKFRVTTHVHTSDDGNQK